MATTEVRLSPSSLNYEDRRIRNDHPTSSNSTTAETLTDVYLRVSGVG
mgnify:CR=1 FL=1